VSRSAYLGTSSFAAAVLRILASSAHRPSLVIAPPDSRRGRGRRPAPPAAAEAAAELGIELLQAADVNAPEVRERIAAAGPPAVVCAFGQLIKEPLLSEVPMLNVHPSLLPRWRGAAPIERAIMAGDERTGVSVMLLSAGLDSGPVALQEEIQIGEGEDFGALSGRLAEVGGRLLVKALGRQDRGELELREQDEAGATYAEKVEPAERLLDPARPAVELARRVRALTPHVGAFLEGEDGERLGVRRARALEQGPEAGRVEVEDAALLLGTADGALEITEVQPPGGRPMSAADYLRGRRPPARARGG
jgi:methionyl-tRNA formyltransferase